MDSKTTSPELKKCMHLKIILVTFKEIFIQCKKYSVVKKCFMPLKNVEHVFQNVLKRMFKTCMWKYTLFIWKMFNVDMKNVLVV